MKQNSRKKTICVFIIWGLIVIVSFLLYNRIVPKEFSEVFYNSDKELIRCTIQDMLYETEISVENETFKELLNLFQDADYYYEGHFTDNVINGNSYIVKMYDEPGNELYLWITDEYKVYFDDKVYDFRNDTEIIAYLKNLF